MNKKGFTLVELLAVIAILAILVIIALPNVMGLFQDAKKSAFRTEMADLVKGAQTEWMKDQFSTAASEKTYQDGTNVKLSTMDVRSDLHYKIKISVDGKVTSVQFYDGSYCYKKAPGQNETLDLKAKDLKDVNDNEILVYDENNDACKF